VRLNTRLPVSRFRRCHHKTAEQRKGSVNETRRRKPAGLCVRIAAALVSLNGHIGIRRSPNFVDRSFSGQTEKE